MILPSVNSEPSDSEACQTLGHFKKGEKTYRTKKKKNGLTHFSENSIISGLSAKYTVHLNVHHTRMFRKPSFQEKNKKQKKTRAYDQ